MSLVLGEERVSCRDPKLALERSETANTSVTMHVANRRPDRPRLQEFEGREPTRLAAAKTLIDNKVGW
jgi:hypothetical protein